jgi:hypothetical protein
MCHCDKILVHLKEFGPILWLPNGKLFGGHLVEKSNGEGCEGI